MSVCPAPALFSVWNVGLSAALHLCPITVMVTAQRKVYSVSSTQLWEHCSYKFQSCSSVSFWQNHLHSMTQSVFAFALRTTQAITGPVLSARGGFFGYESYYRAPRYINHREKQFLLLRKDILPFWFICHYIWTCLYLHYVHVAFTQKSPKHNKKMSSSLIWLKSTTQREHYHPGIEECIQQMSLFAWMCTLTHHNEKEKNNSIETHVLL